MNKPPSSDDPLAGASREQIMSALFTNLVAQQTNMALMLLGKVPHPQTQETIRDIEGARMLIDQLEMLEFKTKGNLEAAEDKLLKECLTGLRMAFVGAIDTPTAEPAAPPLSPSAELPKEGAPVQAKTAAPASASPSEEEARKKFTKKY